MATPYLPPGFWQPGYSLNRTAALNSTLATALQNFAWETSISEASSSRLFAGLAAESARMAMVAASEIALGPGYPVYGRFGGMNNPTILGVLLNELHLQTLTRARGMARDLALENLVVENQRVVTGVQSLGPTAGVFFG